MLCKANCSWCFESSPSELVSDLQTCFFMRQRDRREAVRVGFLNIIDKFYDTTCIYYWI